MKQVDNQEFFKRLEALFEQSKTEGSVYLVQKRLTPAAIEPEKTTHPLIFRASNGLKDKTKRVSVSTVVNEADLVSFWQQYSEALKHGSSGLKKKDKKNKKKKKVAK